MAIEEQIKKTPDNCSGIYKMLDINNIILYIGKAKNLKNRLASYLHSDNLSERIKVMISQIVKIEIIITESELDALILEAQLIKSLKPKYNIVLRDDKTYPYIFLSDHKYPRISKYRGLKDKKGYYYGPYTSSLMVKSTILALQKAFLLRSCSDHFFSSRHRPCIEYDIKHCSAPCVGKISITNYLKSVKLAQDTLNGKSKIVQNQLFQMMKNASQKMDYEYAAIYRDRMKALQQIQEPTLSIFSCNTDMIALYRNIDICCLQILSFRNGYNYGSRAYFINDILELSNNELISSFITQFYKIDVPEKIYTNQKFDNVEIISAALEKISKHKVNIVYIKTQDEKKLFNLAYSNAKEALANHLANRNNLLTNLENLAKTFNLQDIPQRIEVYDNSHISGENQYGVMIVATRNGFSKKDYKRFQIKSSKLGNDYEMMTEVMMRRFSGSIKSIMPDFILIDGGPGHLSIIVKIFKKLKISIPFACIAKGINRNAGNEKFYQYNREAFTLNSNNKLLLYVQSLRNEAHRFAITTHRKKRNYNFISDSKLNTIPNIGINRKKSLLAYFGSIAKIKNSNISEIKKVPGISTKLAQKILDYFSSEE